MLLNHPLFLSLLTTEPFGAGAIVGLEGLLLETQEAPAPVSAAAGRSGLTRSEAPAEPQRPPRPTPIRERRFTRLVRPPDRLTLAQARATGLTNQALAEAPELDAALQDLLEYSAEAEAWIVADGAAARETLKRAAREAGFPRGFGAPVTGVDELGAVVLPTVCRRGLADLAAHYGVRTAGVPPAVSPPSRRHPKMEIRTREYLPHWEMEEATYFVTFRLHDSLPQKVIETWIAERNRLLKAAKASRRSLTRSEEIRLRELFAEKIDKYLDTGSGACWLARPKIAQVVQDALCYFDGQRYRLTAWCLMPNHVHVIFRPLPGHKLEDILHSWKSYTGKKALRILDGGGSFWRKEYYDHLIRDENEFQGVTQYVLENPAKANLPNWPWVGYCGHSVSEKGVVEGRQDASGGTAASSGPTGGVENHGGAIPRVAPDLLRELWTRLETDLIELPLPLLAEMNSLLVRTAHPLKELLKRAEERAVRARFEQDAAAGKLSMASLFQDFSAIVKRLQGSGGKDRNEPPDGAGGAEGANDTSGADGTEGAEGTEVRPEEAAEVRPEEAAAILGPNGPLSKTLPNYEERPEQLEMAARVARALSGGKHLLVEAGTGVGKSLAYLAPAVLFARRASRPVVISTHTKNLQAQLFFKDLPILKRALARDFDAALLKGRPNYLCARKFMYTLQEAAHELDDEERGAMLSVMSWAARTGHGDVGELAAFSPEERPGLWDRLHTVGEDCLARQCPFYHRCFVYKARGLARTADVVVCNHALLFADLNQENGALPPYQEVVFDEAHTLEDAATEHLAFEITPRRVFRLLGKLFRAPPGHPAGRGLLPSLRFQLEQARGDFPKPLFAAIQEHVLEAIQAVPRAQSGADFFFDQMRQWLEAASMDPDGEPPAKDGPPRAPRRRRGIASGRGRAAPFRLQANAPRDQRRAGPGNRRSGGACRRFSAETLRPAETRLFREAKETAVAELGALRRALARLDEDFQEIRRRAVPRARELGKEIGAQGLFLQELIGDLEFVVQASEPNYVYWIERLGRRALRLVAAPLDLSALLHAQLYERKRSVILTSATLSVRDGRAGGEAGFAPLRISERGWRSEKPGMDPLRARRSKSEIRNPKLEIERPHPKSFAFLKRRLGLSLCAEGRLEELLAGSPFDFTRQCRLYVPLFLPEPSVARARDFNAELNALLAPLALASGGRAMVLYTSYQALRAGSSALRKALAPEGIEVLAQREDGSRETLLAKLKAGGRSILLGTASFWEGVDVPGEALSLLVLAKLPFPVFTDPLVEGRCELLEKQGQDPFFHFSVPQAILRLRQGFGRLIRSKSDRGVVVLADKRVLSKRYGPAFLRALPLPASKAADPERLAGDVRAFLA